MSEEETRRLHPRAALAATVAAGSGNATDPGGAASGGVERTVESTEDPGPRRPGAPVPAAMGRYRIVRRLGAGGMGVVYEAHDPQLDRSVAIKVLHERVAARAHLAERLHREARALARVTHPNVVSVYDVGIAEGEVYVVMQYVAGETLDRALARDRGEDEAAGSRGAARNLTAAEERAVLARFDAAGRGLAAAHAAELVHRDFKPANVLVDADGTVRVTDFGLARVSDLAESPSLVTGDLGASMTRGDLVGTPAYMAPEQFLGGPITAATDQFSFGVALWEALCGARPFAGDSLDTIREAVLAGVIAAPPAERRPSRRVEQILRRGLALDPAARFPSMDALLAALAPRRRARKVGAAAGGVAAVAIGAGLVLATGGRSSTALSAPPAPAPPALAPGPAAPPTVLTHLGGCAYAPAFVDHDTVAFDLTRDGDVDLYRVDLDGAAPVQLTRDRGWEWRAAPGAHPDELLFLNQGGERDGADALDLKTGARRIVTNGPGSVVFAGGDYFRAPPHDGVIRRLRDGRDEIFLSMPPGREPDSLVASPTGGALAVVFQDGRTPVELCTISIAQPALACLPLTLHGSRPAFSSDGAALYYDAGPAIDRVALAGGAVTRVLPDLVGAGGIAVAPGGGALVFSDCRSHTALIDVVADPRAGVVRGEADHPTLGPGGAIVYVRRRGAQRTLIGRRPDGVLYELWTHAAGELAGGAFSADSHYLAYVLRGTADAGIYVFTIGAVGGPNRVTEGATDERPVFAGDRIAFTRRAADGTPRLMTVDVAGGDERLVGTRPRRTIGADLTRGRVLLGSPARDRFYWWDPRTGVETPGPQIPAALSPVDVALAPGGDWLLVLGGNNGQEVWRIGIGATPSAPERVYQLATDTTAERGAIDDRGHPIVAIRGWLGELWLARPPAGTRW